MKLSALATFATTLAVAACSGNDKPPPDSCGSVPASAIVTAWTADPHYCMIRFASNLTRARQLAIAPNGDVFVSAGGQIVVVYDDDGDGVSAASERSTFATIPNGNHGLTMTASHVYASASTAVFRWPYAAGDRTATGALETVVNFIPDGGHDKRTLVIDAQNRLYVNIGSGGNVDAPAGPTTPPAERALIRRYDLSAIPAGGHMASAGEVFAAGLRNETGLSIDSSGRMWGVENGRDNLMVGGDIHFDNPAEELNLFDTARPGRNYGYPFCWSEGVWMGAMAKGAGSQHLDPDQPGGFTEAMCQNAAMVVPPAFPMRAHLAPLDVVEYTASGYPSEMRGSLFVTAHGSWNRESGQVGRLIIRLPMGASGPTQAQNFLGEADANGELVEGSWSVRPVSIRVDKAGLLTFSDDQSGTLNKIGYRP